MNRGTEEQRNRGTEEERKRGREEQRKRGTGKQRNRGREEGGTCEEFLKLKSWLLWEQE
jgi:hypothetical protein